MRSEKTFATWQLIVTCSMHALAGLSALVGRQQEDVLAAAAGGEDHPLAGAELHFPRGEVGDHNHQPPNQVFRLVSLLDN